MRITSLLPVLFMVSVGIIFLFGGYGCANIIPPGGGPRDSIPPILVSVTPKDSATNFTGNRITFTFNEYIGQLQNVQENVLVSPTPVNTPIFDSKLRTVTVKLRDTLEPNTTYSINFGNAIQDVNEGNVLKDFTYVFSTGSTVDNYTLSGGVAEAETGKIDTTLIVVLHRNLDDSAVAKERPRYITRLDGKGNFTFRNLPRGTFAVYALPNEFSRRYDDKTKLFAFADKPVVIDTGTAPVSLLAYAEEIKEVSRSAAGGTQKPATASATPKEKLLKYNVSLQGGKQDILTDLQLDFNWKIARYDSNKIVLANNNFQPVNNYRILADTNQTKFTIRYNWPPNTVFNLLIAKDAFEDSTGITLAKNDTIKFTTRNEDEYGLVKLRFNNLDVSKNPVLQIVQNAQVTESVALTQRDWSRKYFRPGEYELRILFDSNKNGKWDAGEFFGKHRQPEVVRFLDFKLVIRANWDNEKEISL